MPKQNRGIVAFGATQRGALNQYRTLANGKGAAPYDTGAGVFVAVARNEGELFNPLSGELDLERAVGVKMDFASHNSGEVHQVDYTVCASGCQSHIVADDASLVQYCPSCGAGVSFSSDEEEDAEEDDAEELDDASDEDGDADADDDGDEEPIDLSDEDPDTPVDDDIAEAASLSADEDEDAEEDSDEDEDAEEEDEESCSADDLDDAEGALDDLDGDDEEIDADEDEEDLESESASGENFVVVAATLDDAARTMRDTLRTSTAFASMSSDGESVPLEYVVCSSGACGAHILSTSGVHECPVCLSGVDEPEDGEEDMEIDADELGDDGDVEIELDSESGDDLSVIDEDEESEDEESEDEESEDEESEESEDEEAEESDEDEEAEADMLEDAVEETAEASDLDVSYCQSVAGASMWTAYVNGQPVATATAGTAGEKVADLFDRPAFGQALIATAGELGVKTALKEFGFRGLSATVALDGVVRRIVDDQVAEARAQIEADRRNFEENFIEALSTAALGMSRNFFADVKENPLHSAIASTLESAGVQNAAQLADRVLAQSADKYHGVLFAKACDLLKQPETVLASMSSAVRGANFMPSRTVHDRVADFGRSTNSAETKPAAPARNISESSAKTDDVLSAALKTLR